MTDETDQQAPEQAAQEEAQNLKPEDVTSLAQLFTLLNENNNKQLDWAKARIQQTQYPQAVQTELAMHRTDLLIFGFNALLHLMVRQEARVEALETLLAKAIGVTKKGK